MVPARHARLAGPRTSRAVLGILATRTRLGGSAGRAAPLVVGAYHAPRAVSYLSSAESHAAGERTESDRMRPASGGGQAWRARARSRYVLSNWEIESSSRRSSSS